MYWNIECRREAAASSLPAQGRFVLHRHVDEMGPHLDLRLEQRECLTGFRIAAAHLEGRLLATEKAPHSARWLEADGDAVREDAGVYCWHAHDGAGGTLELRGGNGVWRLEVSRERGLDAATAGDLLSVCHALSIAPKDAPQLLRDGATARQRAVARFCALGRELDGAAFEEKTWRETLAGLGLPQIQDHLRSFEVRFDLKYPPQPVSVAEALPEEGTGARNSQVLAIARG